MARDVKHAARFVHAICAVFLLAQACARPSPPVVDSSPVQGRSALVAAYPDDPTPGVRARVVCKVTDVSPSRWSDVVIHGDATIESCELVARSECDGHGDIVRPCSVDPLVAPLVPRGVFVLRHELPESARYETFATAAECAGAMGERGVSDDSRAWLDARITTERDTLENAVIAVRSAERRLAAARAAQRPEVPLLQLEVERLRNERDAVAKLIESMKAQRDREGPTIACFATGGS